MMSSEIVRHEPTSSLPEKVEWAKTLAASNLLPAQYRQNPANLLFAVEYADALGVSRINAITSIHVIEGKPSASADLIASLVRRAGHRLRVSGDDTYAEAQLIRADDPEFTYTARWDLAKARAANLLGKGVWKSYPGAMLRSRAITEVARMGASDALFGVIYTPEELGAEVDPSGQLVHQVTQVEAPAPSTGADRIRQVLNTPTNGGSEGSQAETSVAEGEAGSNPAGNPSEPSPPDIEKPAVGITSAQVKKMATAMGEAGLTDRKAALEYVAGVIGRTVTSRNELTKDEASRVIDALERDAAAEADVVEGEIVQEPPSQPASDLNPDEVWKEILRVAEGDHDWNRSQVIADFKKTMGLIPDEASAAELAAYLHTLTTGEDPAA